MVAGIGVYAPAFVSPANIATVLDDTSILFMLVLAQMIVILTRGIDLSVAANLALSGMISASLAQHFPELAGDRLYRDGRLRSASFSGFSTAA